MARVPLPLPLLGLREGAPAGATGPTHYDGGENVCDFDYRGGRVALATRPGLVPMATAGASPALIHQVTRPLQRDAWAELTTTAASGTVPPQVSTTWTERLDSRPVVVEVGPLGNSYTLLESGAVVVRSPKGTVLSTLTIPVPTGFSLVPSLGIDDDGYVYAASRYPFRIDGGAGRLHRMVELNGVWSEDGSAPIEWSPTRFTLDRGEIVMALQRPDDWDTDPEADGPAPLELISRIAALQGTPFEAWNSAAAQPVTALDVSLDGTAIYVASARNASRAPSSSSPGVPQQDWLPRDATVALDGASARQALYMHLSALRAQNVQGLADGAVPANWEEARFDEVDLPEVIDTTPRAAISLIQRKPLFDTNGMGGAPGWVLNGSRAFVSTPGSGFHEKTTADDLAGWSRCVFPNMRDATGAGARFAVHMLLKLDALVTANPPSYIISQGEYALYYDADGADTEVTFEYPGGTSSVTIPGQGERTLLWSFVHAGDGVASSAWFLSDAAIEYSVTGLTVEIPRANQRTCIGGYPEMLAPTWSNHSGRFEVGDLAWNIGRAWTCIEAHEKNGVFGGGDEPGRGANHTTYWTVVPKLGMVGALAEVLVFLGGSTVVDSPHDTTVTTGLRQKMEGFTAWAYGRQSVLAPSSPYDLTEGAPGPPSGIGSTASWDVSAGLAVPQGITAKYDRTTGRVVWVTKSVSGSGVAAAPDGYLYSTTNEPSTSGAQLRVRRHKDEGATVRSSGTDCWSISDGTGDPWPNETILIAADECGDLYIPWVDTDAVTPRAVRRYKAEGNELGGPALHWTYELGGDAYPVACVPGGLAVDLTETSGVCGPEFLYVAAAKDADAPAAEEFSMRRVEVLGRARTTELRDREVQTLVFGADGRLERSIDGGALASVATAGTLGTERPWAVNILGKVYIGGADTEYRVFDPLKGTLADWDVEGRSARPRRLVLGVRWRNRIVGVSVDDPHVMHASAVRRPMDWDVAPQVVTATQAFAGTTAAAGNAPEPITALMPWLDDLMLVGSANGVLRITGDPATGGQLDDVEAHDGVAYGTAWTRGPGDSLYWFSARGQLKRVTPRGGIENLSEGAVPRRLQEIDLSLYRVDLAWSEFMNGVFVLLTRRGGAIEDIVHYFVSAATGGWHPVRFGGGADRAVTAAGYFSSDRPTGSGLLLGFADGGLRRLDRDAWDDDGEPLNAWVRIPVTTNAARGETILTDAELVTSEFGGTLRVGGLASRVATAPGQPMSLVDAPAGRPDLVPIQVAGPYTWLHLEGSEPWALYDAAVFASGGGLKR